LIERIDTSPAHVWKFGLLFGLIGALATGYLLYRGSDAWVWTASAAVFFVLTGLAAQPVLKPLYIAWMAFAFILGWINTRLLLGVFFYLMVTPIGLLLRLTGKDLLDKKIDRPAKTYWKKREKKEFEPSRYERLF
jgi:hypothetical protein